jgi:hypothetical protein
MCPEPTHRCAQRTPTGHNFSSCGYRTGARQLHVVTTLIGVEEGALWLPESDPHDLAAQKTRRRTAETASHDHPCHGHAPSAGVRRPRMSRFGGAATGTRAATLSRYFAQKELGSRLRDARRALRAEERPATARRTAERRSRPQARAASRPPLAAAQAQHPAPAGANDDAAPRPQPTRLTHHERTTAGGAELTSPNRKTA